MSLTMTLSPAFDGTLHFQEVTGALPKVHFGLRRAPPVAIESEQRPFYMCTTHYRLLDVDRVLRLTLR
jgi:hypothetical protein